MKRRGDSVTPVFQVEEAIITVDSTLVRTLSRNADDTEKI